jgi:hypothetical protein
LDGSLVSYGTTKCEYPLYAWEWNTGGTNANLGKL